MEKATARDKPSTHCKKNGEQKKSTRCYKPKERMKMGRESKRMNAKNSSA